MSLLFQSHHGERGSAPPMTMNTSSHPLPMNTGSIDAGWANPGWLSRIPIPRAWLGMTGYLVAGVFLGLVLIVALTLSRSSDSDKRAGLVTDNVVRLKAQDIGESCFRGTTKDGPARVTVSMEVGLDGKVRSAVASGESSALRSCVETHVKGWEFLPQAHAQAMVLPFEIERR